VDTSRHPYGTFKIDTGVENGRLELPNSATRRMQGKQILLKPLVASLILVGKKKRDKVGTTLPQ
jgi:hypothetical protein